MKPPTSTHPGPGEPLSYSRTMSPLDLVVSALTALVTGAVGWSVWQRFIRRKYESTNQVECCLRHDPPDEVTTGRWRPGLATLNSGRIDFQPRSSLGLRLNSGAPFVIPVLSVSTTGRHPSWRQAWHLNPGLEIVMLETATGPIELAVRPESIQQLVSKVDQSVQ
jgi:hypothetical protein